ncbi:MAG: FitA-like ribbon-helix-helix domain-containing protein [Thermoanaerobaculia bacterium]
MADIVIRDISPDIVERLGDRARSHGCSLETEVKAILESVVLPHEVSTPDPLEISEYWHRRLAGRMTSDSADLLREDRDR